MKKIMFLYHIREREYWILSMIREQIEKCAGQDDVDIKIAEFYSSMKTVIEFMPDVIVSIPPRDSYSSNYLTVLKLITRAVVISMTTEGYHSLGKEDVDITIGTNTHSERLVDLYIMWGPGTAKILGRALHETGKVSDLRRIKVAGYAAYEAGHTLPLVRKNPKFIKLEKWASGYKKIILFVTGFTCADMRVEDFFYQGAFPERNSVGELTEEECEYARRIAAEEWMFRQKYVEDIIRIAEEMPDTGIIVKLHPAELSLGITYYDFLQKFKNIYLVKDVIPIGGILNLSDSMVHYNSTSNMEAYICHVPTIQRYNTDHGVSIWQVWSRISESAYTFHINDYVNLKKCLEEGPQYKRNPRIEKDLYEYFNWKSGEKYMPVEKIAAYILRIKKAQRLCGSDTEVYNALRSAEGMRLKKMLTDNWLDHLGDDSWHDSIRRGRRILRVYFFEILGGLFSGIKKKGKSAE